MFPELLVVASAPGSALRRRAAGSVFPPAGVCCVTERAPVGEAQAPLASAVPGAASGRSQHGVAPPDTPAAGLPLPASPAQPPAAHPTAIPDRGAASLDGARVSSALPSS